MVHCVVPFCKSVSKKNRVNNGISFHEFPSDLEICEIWLKVICRADFKVNFNTRSNCVCSRHFKQEDYRDVRGKIRMLKKDSVPSVFPDYPEYALSHIKTVLRSLKRKPNEDSLESPNNKNEIKDITEPMFMHYEDSSKEFDNSDTLKAKEEDCMKTDEIKYSVPSDCKSDQTCKQPHVIRFEHSIEQEHDEDSHDVQVSSNNSDDTIITTALQITSDSESNCIVRSKNLQKSANSETLHLKSEDASQTGIVQRLQNDSVRGTYTGHYKMPRLIKSEHSISLDENIVIVTKSQDIIDFESDCQVLTNLTEESTNTDVLSLPTNNVPKTMPSSYENQVAAELSLGFCDSQRLEKIPKFSEESKYTSYTQRDQSQECLYWKNKSSFLRKALYRQTQKIVRIEKELKESKGNICNKNRYHKSLDAVIEAAKLKGNIEASLILQKIENFSKQNS